MPERWRAELRQLRMLEPGPDLWARAAEGPRMELARAPRGRRTVAIVVAALLLAAAGFAAWHAFSPLARPREVPANGGSWIRLPSTPGSPGANRQLGAMLVVRTTLPRGTVLAYRYDLVGPKVGGVSVGGGGGGAGLRVTGRTIRIGIVGSSCAEQFNRGTGFTIRIAVGPRIDGAFYQATTVSGASSVIEQPRAILDRFGRRFERFPGANVITGTGDHVLLVSATYTWPTDACGSRGP